MSSSLIINSFNNRLTVLCRLHITADSDSKHRFLMPDLQWLLKYVASVHKLDNFTLINVEITFSHLRPHNNQVSFFFQLVAQFLVVGRREVLSTHFSDVGNFDMEVLRPISKSIMRTLKVRSPASILAVLR